MPAYSCHSKKQAGPFSQYHLTVQLYFIHARVCVEGEIWIGGFICFVLRILVAEIYLRNNCDLASINSTPSPSSGCSGRPARSETTASMLAWSRSLKRNKCRDHKPFSHLLHLPLQQTSSFLASNFTIYVIKQNTTR